MKVINEIQIYEINGGPLNLSLEDCSLQVMSHWVYKNRVVLKFQDKSITVLQSDLMLAIQNATNVRL